ncbi:P-type conjugative transfer protein TrbJ [Collimonas sp. H4R21]|uniref:P-type conjugative transfer protein TrbJ n=1 Tax=Collimonas rhizosphaerae TaxID=3126357 RepID=A0ABU9PWQ9_9BURK
MHVVKKILAAKIVRVLIMAATLIMIPKAYAGIPVIDGTNLSQNIMTAMESVAQTLKQVEQYKTQLQQYENMLQNTTAPAAYIWDQASGTINQLMGAIDTLNYYKQQTGSIDSYLSRYQNVGYYSSSPCFTGGGCTAAQTQALRDGQTNSSDALKRANDAVLRGVDQQQTAMQADARQLIRLQQQAQGATGQMAAIQYANQLASSQTNQLLQIRGLLVAQQNAEATRAAVSTDREAQEAASALQLRKGTFKKSSSEGW